MRLNENILMNLKESNETVNAKIYQIKDTTKSDYIFKPYKFAKDKLNLDDYDLVADIDVNNGDYALEDIFTLGNTNKNTFNIIKPMRSISVSDIIELNGKKYYVNDFGFEELQNENINESEKVEKSQDLGTQFRGKARELAKEYAVQIAQEYARDKKSRTITEIAESVIYQLINNLSYAFNDEDAVKMVDKR